MSDLDLGIIDRRTVIVAIIIFVLAGLLVQYQIPVNTGDFIQLFIDIALLVGYVYLARSVFRLPLYLVLALPSAISFGRIVSDGLLAPHIAPDSSTSQPQPTKPSTSKVRAPVRILTWFLTGVVALVVLPFLLVSFKEFRLSNIRVSFGKGKYLWVTLVLGIIDRLALVAIIFLAAHPVYRTQAQWLGVCGLILMLVVYVIGGSFTYIVRDELDPKKNDTESKEVSVSSSIYDPVFVKIVTESTKYPGIPDPVKVEVANDYRQPVKVEVVNLH